MSMELTWHGHSCWRVTIDETSFLIDPFFENPHTSMDPDDVDSPDYLLLTHGHADHIADASGFTQATVVGVPEMTGYMQSEIGFDSSIGMNIGGTVSCGDGYVTMHRADHTNGLNTGYERSLGVPVGFILSESAPVTGESDTTTTFYHAGDTGLMSEMKDVIGQYIQPDAAALPTGDHFTMGPTQTAIAADWLGVEHLFPMHYDTFGPIEIETEDLLHAVENRTEGTTVHVLDGDESYTLT
jgi:Predicted Zn-dependent hydrolases of the beta-lactamase fold